MASGGQSTAHVGQRRTRVEDRRFLTGTGRFTADRFAPGDLVCGFVRSDVANGQIRGIHTASALALEGIVAVLTAADLRAAGAQSLTCVHEVECSDRPKMFDPGRPALADEFVRFVGDPVALVVGRDAASVADGMEAVRLEIEESAPVMTLEGAVKEGAPRIWAGAPGNVSFRFEDGDRKATEAAFAQAAHVVSVELVNNRVAMSPLEPRGARCSVDPTTGRTVLACATQGAHEMRNYLADVVFREPREAFRVVTPDVGGSFGMKIMCYAEHVALVVAARKLARPVTWMASRTGSFLSDHHGRDHLTRVDLALDADGRFLALRCDTLANMGAYLAQTGSAIPTIVHATVFGGCYDFGAVHMAVRGIFTNQPSTDAYRGAGVPEATYALERLVDIAAAELGVDRFDLRRRNLVKPERMPYAMAIGRTVDVGDYPAVFEAALRAADIGGFPRRREAARRGGQHLGIGLACYIHGTGGYPQHDTARIEVTGEGVAMLYCGAMQAGQGHETAFAQVLADRLGIDIERIDVREGDSDDLENSGGTGGSSSMVVAMRSVLNAVEALLTEAAPSAAQLLQIDANEVTFKDGRFHSLRTGGSVALLAVASEREAGARRAGTPMGSGCTGVGRFEGEPRAFPYGTHVCEVAVDPATMHVAVERYTALDDIGTVVNPMIAEGQIHGGVAQGLGQALNERVVYDEATGQLLSASLMDYTLPRADDAPKSITWQWKPIPSSNNPPGMKGVGEVGAIAAPPAAINAICDALGARHVDMPATPGRLFEYGSKLGRAATGRGIL